ncbi:hypothetical protein BGW80DRAFT_274687 [Lactifluus volemus]|nr:hypothetical protein BGW80DRAFT_274687 [Lactifluus volemus]
MISPMFCLSHKLLMAVICYLSFPTTLDTICKRADKPVMILPHYSQPQPSYAGKGKGIDAIFMFMSNRFCFFLTERRFQFPRTKDGDISGSQASSTASGNFAPSLELFSHPSILREPLVASSGCGTFFSDPDSVRLHMIKFHNFNNTGFGMKLLPCLFPEPVGSGPHPELAAIDYPRHVIGVIDVALT